MKVEIGNKAPQFPFWEYIKNRIFFAVYPCPILKKLSSGKFLVNLYLERDHLISPVHSAKMAKKADICSPPQPIFF